MISKEEILRARELAQKATNGPWDFDLDRSEHDSIIYKIGSDKNYHSKKYNYIAPDSGGVVGSSEWMWINDEDVKFIAHHNPEFILRLLDHVEELQKTQCFCSSCKKQNNHKHNKEMDALKERLEDAEKVIDFILSNYPIGRDGMDNEGPLPVGIKGAREYKNRWGLNES